VKTAQQRPKTAVVEILKTSKKGGKALRLTGGDEV
jgi:hypothetical protein